MLKNLFCGQASDPKPVSLSKSAGVESSVYLGRIENKYPDINESKQITPR